MKSHEQMLNEVESDLTVRIFNKGGSGEFISYEREKGYPEGTTFYSRDKVLALMAEAAKVPEVKLLPTLTLHNALTVLMQTDDGADDADRYIANIDKGQAILATKSEMFFHQLRLRVALEPLLADKISVLFYQDGKYKKVGLYFKDELSWPVGFLQGAWEKEGEIQAAREAAPQPTDGDPGRSVKPHRSGGGHWVGDTERKLT